MSLTPVVFPDRFEDLLGNSGSAPVRIGVIDSGWDGTIRPCPVLFGSCVDLTRGSGRMRAGEVPVDEHGHGTACLSTCFRMCPNAVYSVFRVFSTRLSTPVLRVVRAIEVAAEMGIDVINLSLRTTEVTRQHAMALYTVCRAATDAGAVLLASSPPDGRLSLPAAFDCVIGVTMANHLSPCEFDYLEGRPAEIAAAPGIEGRVLWRGGNIRELRRTSFGTAIAGGIVGRIRARYANAHVSGVRNILRHFASDNK